MSRRLNVLHVSSARVYGGNEEHVRTLLKYLDHDACNVVVAAPSDGEFARVLAREGVPTEHIEIAEGRLLRSAKALARLCRDHRVDLVHSHNRREDVVAAAGGWLAKTPVRISTIHDRINMTQEGERARGLSCRAYNWVLRHGFDALLAVSRATRDDVIDQAGVRPETIHHVVNGMDLARLEGVADGPDLRPELGLTPDDLVCGMVARVRGTKIDKKGHRYLIEAIPPVLERVPNAKFVVAGADDAAAAFLQQMAAERGAGDPLRVLSYRTDVLDVMRTFDVAVLPSLFEGLPRTLMEAMALGKPAVGTSVDGIAELVVHDECGLLVPPRDADALAGALIRVLGDTDLRRRMGAAAAQRIATEFDGRVMADRTLAIYRRLAEAKGVA